MKLQIQTKVEKSREEVWAGFTQDLFLSLSPPFPPVRLLQFDGCMKGDVVGLELNFLVFKQKWISLITDQRVLEKETYFIDKGMELPFFLRFWEHKHRLISQPDGKTVIADEIEYKTPFGPLADVLFFPILWLQFAYRRPIYQNVFKQSANQ